MNQPKEKIAMDTVIIMNDGLKQKMGILSFIPLLAFTLCFIYYLFAIKPVIAANDAGDHIGLTTQTSLHYNTIFILLAISGIIAATVLIYFIVHLARVKQISSAKKVQWIIFLTAFVPIALPIFWYYEISKEPARLVVYPNIE